MSKWIKVEDQLPVPGESVLCWCNHQNVFHSHIKWKHINIGEKHSYDDEFTLENDDTTFVSVTHWRPLPKPPTE